MLTAGSFLSSLHYVLQEILLVRTDASVKVALGIEGLSGTLIGLAILIGFELVMNSGIEDITERTPLFGKFNTMLALKQFVSIRAYRMKII